MTLGPNLFTVAFHTGRDIAPDPLNTHRPRSRLPSPGGRFPCAHPGDFRTLLEKITSASEGIVTTCMRPPEDPCKNSMLDHEPPFHTDSQ